MASSFLWTFSGLLLLTGYAFAQTTITNGTEGDVCGPNDRKCLFERAQCEAGVCKCDDEYNYGNGLIQCYENNTVSAEVYNDPLVNTYNNNKIQLPLPCRYLFTDTVTWLKNRQRKQVGTCRLKTHAFHLKHKGKFYIAGYDIAIKIIYFNGMEKNISLRMYGLATNGVYSFYLNATDNAFVSTGWLNDPVNFIDPSTGLKIKFRYQNEDNLAILYIKKCGINIQFRPYDAGLRLGQPYVPHVAYGINCAFHPVFKNQDSVVAIPPAFDHGGLTIDDIPPIGFTREEKLFLRALNSGAQQNSPYPNLECDNVRAKMNACNTAQLHQAFDYCMFLLESPRFIRCYDDTFSGEKIMGLFGMCVDVYCAPGVDSCQNVKDLITVDNCHLKAPYPAVDDFLALINCL